MDRIFAAPQSVNIADLAPSPYKDFGSLVNVVVKNAFVLAGIITFFLLVVGGFGMITAAGSGDSKKLEQGKQTLTNALIGLLIVVGSYWIIEILSKITGLNLLSPPVQ